jgi:hypothetical protein
MNKRCSKCGETKNAACFSRNRTRTDGFQHRCKKCVKEHYNLPKVHLRALELGRSRLSNPSVHTHQLERHRAYYRIPQVGERIREYSRLWGRTNAGKESARKNSANQKNWHPDRCRARWTLNNAISRGEIVRQPCSVCGSIHMIHGHHPDHSKPLGVIWLCRKHHAELHNKEREASWEKPGKNVLTQ